MYLFLTKPKATDNTGLLRINGPYDALPLLIHSLPASMPSI